MKFKVLVIAAVLVLCVLVAWFAKGIIEERNALNDYDALAEQVNAYNKVGDYAAAIPLLKRMHKLKPEELMPVEYLGIFYNNLPEERPALTNALFWLTEAEKRGSSNYLVYYNFACLYSLKGDVERAEAEMDKAIALGYFSFEWMSQDDDLVNFRNGSWWGGIADNYTQIEQLLAEFNEFVSCEADKSVTDRITFYDGIVTALKELAPHIPTLQNRPLFLLASSYEVIENYVSAEQNYLEARVILERVLGKEHPYYAIIANNVERLYKNMSDYATELNNQGLLYESLGDYEKAERYYLEAAAIRERALGKEHPDYATMLNNLGVLYYRMADYAKAERYYLEAADIREKVLGKEHPDYATSLNNLGVLYESMGEYEKAESFYLESRAIYEKALGKEHPSYAATLNNLGRLYWNMGEYEKAESFYLESRAIREKALGKEHPDYATSLNNLGLLYESMGEYEKAESFYLESRAIWEKTLGKEHPDYATSLNNLGGLYDSMGEYEKAESFYLESRAITEKALGKEHPSYTITVNNLGLLYKEMGDYAKAESFYLESQAISEKILGKEHPYYAISLGNLGGLYEGMGDYAKAESFYLESQAIREKALGKEHPSYATILVGLGLLYKEMGEYEKAESFYLESRAIREKALGKEHPDYARSLNNLGFMYESMGEYEKAESFYLESRAITEKTLGKEHPDYAVLLDNLYALYLSKKEYTQALTYKQEQIKINTAIVNKNFSFQTEQQRNAYWNANSKFFERSYSLSFFYPIPASNILNYDNALFSKGLLLRTTNAVRDSIYASGNQTLIGQFEELGRIRQQISTLRQSGGNEAYIKSLEDKAEALEKSLTQSSREFREFEADLVINWQDIQKSLQTNEAAIEFVSFRIFDKKMTDTVQYAALVLKPDSEAPAWVPLCDEEQLQNILRKAVGTSEDQTKIIYEIYGQDLYSLVWEPLEKELENIKTIYYSPSGLFHKITFGALPTGEDEDISFNFDNDSGDDSDEDYDFYDDLGNDEDIKRLADKYDLNLVSSTREVAHFAKSLTETASVSAAVLYGGLDYNADEETMRVAAQFYEKNDVLIASAPPEGVTRGGAWIPLPATRIEVQNIQDYLNRKQIPNTLYQDGYGNEESFKQLDGKKTGLIHLATHGFFLADVERKHDEREQQQQQRGGVLRAAENPLLRSGLLLAGGNHAWTNNPVEGVESGILTADKIAGMNLLGTKLVVMSACQTGLGDVNNGEGVFGLQRAFKLAGVETLIMSLWEVDDAATAKLMSVFYQEWLFSGRSKQEAFKEAQRQVRAEHPDPYYWAAFVMMD